MSGINAEIIDYLKLEKQVRLDGLKMMDKSTEIPQRLLKEVSIFDRWIEHLANGVLTGEKQCNLPVVNDTVLCDCCEEPAEFHFCEKHMDENTDRISTGR